MPPAGYVPKLPGRAPRFDEREQVSLADASADHPARLGETPVLVGDGAIFPVAFLVEELLVEQATPHAHRGADRTQRLPSHHPLLSALLTPHPSPFQIPLIALHRKSLEARRRFAAPRVVPLSQWTQSRT